MALISSLPDYCDGTRTIEDLAAIMGCTRSYCSTQLNKLSREGIIVLDTSRRPMKPYRFGMRPDYYFNSQRSIPPVTRATKFDNYIDLLANAANTMESVSRVIELLVNGSPNEATELVRDATGYLGDEARAFMLLSILSNLYGAENIVARVNKKSLDTDRPGE